MPEPMDIALAFGLDESIAEATFAAEKAIAKNIVRAHNVSPTSTLFGVISYDNDAYIKLKFSSGDERVAVINAIDKLQKDGSGSNVTKVLELARDQLFTSQNGARRYIPKVMVLFLDKLKTRDGAREKMAADLGKAGVKLIVVAVGPEVEKAALSGLINDSSRILYPSDIVSEVKNVTMSIDHVLKSGRFFVF